MSCSGSTPWLVRTNSTTPHATYGAWKAPSHWWRPSAKKSRQLATLPCLPVRWEGGELHPRAMANAHPLPGTCGAGVEYQLGGKLDPSGRVGPEELDSCWQPAGRAEGGGDSVHRGDLPPHQDSGPRLPGRRS